MNLEVNDRPKHCEISLLRSCMFKCKTCNMWQIKREPDEMTIAEWKKYLGELADFVGKSIPLVFMGGEPLIKEGICELIKFASQKGYNTVLITNAYLIDEDMARKIGDSGLTTIILSLHGLKEETHDFVTGVKGSFERLIRAIDLLHKYRSKMSIGLNTIILNVNLDELVKMAEWVNGDERLWKIYFCAVVRPFVPEPDRQWYKKSEHRDIWPEDLPKLYGVIDELIGLAQKGYKIDNPVAQLKLFKGYFRDPYGFIKKKAAIKGNCPRGDASFEVSPAGEISLCPHMDPFGNVKKDNIRDLWYSPRVIEIRRKINNCQRECDTCVNDPYNVEDSVLDRAKSDGE